LLGHIAIMAGDADTAVDRFSEARLLAPDEPAIVEDLIRAQMASGLFREAERGLARLRRRPESSERRDLRHQQATCMIELGRPTEARALFRGLTQEIDGAGDIEAWSGLGETAYLLGDDGDLRRAASRVMSIAPREETGYVLFAMYHLLRNDTDAALKAVEDGVSRAGGHVELLSLRAVAFARAGRNAEADATLAQMESGSHNDAAARVRKAIGASDYAGVTTD
jgi:Flp pilus assembly protein TadD